MAITDHFRAEFGFPLTDTRALRSAGFTPHGAAAEKRLAGATPTKDPHTRYAPGFRAATHGFEATRTIPCFAFIRQLADGVTGQA